MKARRTGPVTPGEATGEGITLTSSQGLCCLFKNDFNSGHETTRGFVRQGNAIKRKDFKMKVRVNIVNIQIGNRIEERIYYIKDM